MTTEVTGMALASDVPLSKMHAQRVLKIGLLNIIYRRIYIPESEFVPKMYEDISYMVFKRETTNKFNINYHDFTSPIIYALELNYLKEMFLYIMDNNTYEILEIYNFKVEYNKDALESTTNLYILRNGIVDLFQALSNIPGEKWSPDKVELLMELNFNKEMPFEYRPPIFKLPERPFYTNLPYKLVNLVSVNTGFHKITVQGRGRNFTRSQASTPAPSSCVNEETLNDDYQKDKQQKGLKRKNKDEVEHEIQKKETKTDFDRVGSSFNITDETILDNVTILPSKECKFCKCKFYGIVHL